MASRPPWRIAIRSRLFGSRSSGRSMAPWAGPARPRRKRGSRARTAPRCGHGLQTGRRARMRLVVLGHHHQSGGVLVEPVHDARPPFAADAGEAFAAMGDERIDQRAGPMPGGGMNNEATGFVDDDDVVVLIDHVERNGFGPGAAGTGGGISTSIRRRN